MRTAYVNGKVLADGRLQEGLAVQVENGLIREVAPPGQMRLAGMETIDLHGHILLPGFVDVQVNGGGGVLFNDTPTVDGARAIANAHSRFGTTGLLPTLISDDLDVVQQGLAAVAAAIQADVPGVLGIHIEGPFLNVQRKGVHDAGKIQNLTRQIISELEPLNMGATVLTVAPETLEPGMVRELSEKGFLVCAGHSNANHAQLIDAIGQGMRGFTHLFNAMSQLGSREPGMVGTALDSETTWAGIIADGHHVADASLRIAYRCKGPEKLMLVSDAMPPVGSDEDHFTLLGNPVKVKNGVCVDENGTLAGTALDMATALRTMMRATGCGLSEASMMASTAPARFLGLEQRLGRIAPGLSADFAVLDARLQTVKTVIAGQQAWPR